MTLSNLNRLLLTSFILFLMVLVSFAQHGLMVEETPANYYGIYVGNTGSHGIFINSANHTGVHVDESGRSGFSVGSANGHGFYATRVNDNGFNVYHADDDGIHVQSADGWSMNIQGRKNFFGNPSGHIGQIYNRSTGSSPDVLALKVGTTGIPGAGTNYITYFNGNDDILGEVQGNGSSGVCCTTGACD